MHAKSVVHVGQEASLSLNSRDTGGVLSDKATASLGLDFCVVVELC